MARILIISGGPCTGKTTLAETIARFHSIMYANLTPEYYQAKKLQPDWMYILDGVTDVSTTVTYLRKNYNLFYRFIIVTQSQVSPSEDYQVIHLTPQSHKHEASNRIAGLRDTAILFSRMRDVTRSINHLRILNRFRHP